MKLKYMLKKQKKQTNKPLNGLRTVANIFKNMNTTQYNNNISKIQR